MSNNSEKNHNLSSLLEDIKLELLSYINKKIRLFKLDAYEKVSMSASILGYVLIVASIVSFALFFILMGLAFLIGEILGSQAAGFGVIALFSLFLLLVVFLFRGKIKNSILSGAIKIIRKMEADEK
jgi:membrane-bound ClpP family serine protease